jgi:hypothetical protein
MKENPKTIKLLLNAPLLNKPKGTIVTVPIDSNGKLASAYWTARLNDAQTDNCVSIFEGHPDEKNIKKAGKKS